VIVGDWPRLNAERRDGGWAVIDRFMRRTWAEIDDRVNALCHVVAALFESDGVADLVVGILADNRIEHLELMFAASRGKFIHTGLNTRHTVDEMIRQIDDARLTLLLVGGGYEDTARAIQQHRPIVRCVGLHGTDLPDQYEALIAGACNDAVPSHGDPEAVYSLVYTSGSTGEPKGVMVSSRNEIAYGRSVAWTIELSDQDRVLNVAPLFHRGGQFFAMTCAQHAVSLILATAPDPSIMLDDVAREGATHVLVVPTLLKGIVEVIERDPERITSLGSLRQVMCGSAPLSVDLARRLLNILPVNLCQGAGTSEGGLAMSLRSRDYREALQDDALAHRMSSVGRPSPGFRVAVVDDNDKVVPDGAVGELVYQGDAFIQGYWRRPEASARAWRNGWFHSGDLGRRDADGYIYYVDRLFGRIKTGAETVYAREVEQVLESHPDVVEIAVVGMPHEHWGEAITAVVATVRKLGRDEERSAFADGLRDYGRQNGLAGYKIPKRVIVVDALPKTSTSKVALGEVKELVKNLSQVDC
jgi:fatty-acyl-CoA synthase